MIEIRRCRHIKVNGTQCGSPALRGQCYCYFHNIWRNLGTYGDPQQGLHDPHKGRFPVLEDANSVQAALMQVVRLMLAKEIKAKEAGLLLYALQIASCNLKNLRLELFCKEEVVVDTLLVGHSPLDGHPARQEDLEPENEKDKKAVNEHEKYLKRYQQKADAQWETEVRELERSQAEESNRESVVSSQRSGEVPEISAQAECQIPQFGDMRPSTRTELARRSPEQRRGGRRGKCPRHTDESMSPKSGRHEVPPTELLRSG